MNSFTASRASSVGVECGTLPLHFDGSRTGPVRIVPHAGAGLGTVAGFDQLGCRPGPLRHPGTLDARPNSTNRIGVVKRKLTRAHPGCAGEEVWPVHAGPIRRRADSSDAHMKSALWNSRFVLDIGFADAARVCGLRHLYTHSVLTETVLCVLRLTHAVAWALHTYRNNTYETGGFPLQQDLFQLVSVSCIPSMTV